jgi:predicted transcriptional regulator
MASNHKPTDSELAILQELWKKGPSTVRSVHDNLPKKGVGYTTILKLMQIMNGKGLLTRNTEARSHIYKANVSEKEVQSSMLKKVIDTAFQGSTYSLVLEALGNKRVSQKELEELKSLIDSLDNKKEV